MGPKPKVVASDPGKVRCLGYCNKDFQSPNKKLIRICPGCKVRQRSGEGYDIPDLTKRQCRAVPRIPSSVVPVGQSMPSKFNFTRKKKKAQQP